MDINDIIKPENLVYKKPALMNDNHMHYCPGCSHGVVHKLVAELIEEMGLGDRAVGIAPVGCAVFAYNYIDIDWIEAAHGRAPAIATAVNRLYPGNLVFTYKATATWLPSVLPRLSMPPTAVRTLQSSSSTMQSTA